MRLKQQIHTDYWEERANKVLSHFNYNFPDEIDMYDICWRYGIRIMPLDYPFLDQYVQLESIENLDAFSIPKEKGRRGIIFIREDLNSIEKKLLLAEEFCHIYSHHTSQLNLDKHGVAKIENQAKRMSAYLLMPSKFIETIYDAAVDEAVLITDIADYFLVTEEFAHYRMELIFNRRVDGFSFLKGNIGTIQWFE
ncbi:hypothetical protein BEP19_15050 [Ammoniphilus oxalaticus]|uniref:IrrE N-terminal-like domain-containing protein n=1 Tax=Ammoniphilus oxalaticus TaxID=66863 RepID=A0A419SD20_9BACL|nr:ImmA/IrrE family metallo-endopeptidase [Ammoniphilus oxalaticus]RKD20998.1 hypothetical protein BEP19_15050 [Ammoniphilus oxalaticus]